MQGTRTRSAEPRTYFSRSEVNWLRLKIGWKYFSAAMRLVEYEIVSNIEGIVTMHGLWFLVRIFFLETPEKAFLIQSKMFKASVSTGPIIKGTATKRTQTVISR